MAFFAAMSADSGGSRRPCRGDTPRPPGGRSEKLAEVGVAVVEVRLEHLEVLARVDPGDLKGPLAPAVLAWPLNENPAQ